MSHTRGPEPTGQRNETEWVDYWGSSWQTKSQQSLRVGFCNIGGIGQTSKHIRNSQLHTMIDKHKIDIMGVAETNVNWKKSRQQDRLYERTKRWWQTSKVHQASNTTDKNSPKHQFGGVANFSVGKIAYKCQDHGKDPTNLGRWVWTRYRGQGSIKLKVITAYAPGPYTTVGSVNAQHQLLFDSQNKKRESRAAFKQDLLEMVAESIAGGDQVMLLMDANEKVNDEAFLSPFENLGLHEAVFQHWPMDEAPNTYRDGSRPIDCILASSSLQIIKAGYSTTEAEHWGDHRTIWCDVSTPSALGQDVPNIVHLGARRLKLNDPRIIKAYVLHAQANLAKHNLRVRAVVLEQAIQEGLEEWHDMYEQLDALRTKILKAAENACRKFRAGKVAWSPTIAKAMASIEYWRLTLKRATGKRINGRRVRQLARKYDFQCNTRDTTQIQLALAKAVARYIRLKKDATKLRKGFLEVLATAQAEKSGVAREKKLKKLIKDEEVRTLGRRVKYARGKMASGGLTMVLTQNNRGEWIERHTKREIEIGCLRENSKRFSQAKNTPFYSRTLSRQFGWVGNTPASREVLEGRFTMPPGVDPHTAGYISHLARPPGIQPIQHMISTDKWVQA